MLRYFHDEKPSPNTDVFFGSVGNAIKNGFVDINGQGNTAVITFRDSKRKEHKAKIKVYTLTKLKKTDIYQSTVEENEVENLVHVWKTIRNSNTILKYAGPEQQAFMLTVDDSLMLEEIYRAAFGSLTNIDYFKEVIFCHLLHQKTTTDIDALKNLPGMNEEKIIHLLKNTWSLNSLLDHQITIQQLASFNEDLFKFLLKNQLIIKKLYQLGLTVEQIQSIDVAKLNNCIEHEWELQQALMFVTLEQILGINHTPKPIPKIIKEKPLLSLGFGGGSCGEFNYDRDDQTINIWHTNSQAKLTVTIGILKEEKIEIINQLFGKLETEAVELVHQWFITRHTNPDKSKTNILYCPTMQFFHQEEIDAAFPEEVFRKTYMLPLMLTPYYEEIMFNHFLNEHGHSIVAYKQLPGMTLEKVEVLFTYHHSLDFLLKKGMKLQDFAKVDLHRLNYILENANKAEYALKFVEARELLNIQHSSRNYAATLFPAFTQPIHDNKENSAANNCLMM